MFPSLDWLRPITMHWALLLCLVLPFAPQSYAQNSPIELLDAADDLRMRDHRHAQQILSQIDVANLPEHEQHRFEYLRILTNVLDGELKQAPTAFGELLSRTQDQVLRLRIMQSLLSVQAGLRTWEPALILADEMVTQLEQTTTTQYLADAYLALAIFYRQLGEYAIALDFTQQALNINGISPTVQCAAMTTRVYLRFQLHASEIQRNEFSDAEAFCERHKFTLYLASLKLDFAHYLFETQNEAEAKEVALAAQTLAQQVNFLPQITSLNALLARIEWGGGNAERAQAYANKALELDPEGQFEGASVEALKVLQNVALAQQKYDLAYNYLQRRYDLQQIMYDRQLAQQLAVQQTRLRLSQKDTQIALLDKQNTLLEAEAELAKEQLENSVMVLVLAVFVLSVLIYTAIRGRRLQNRLRVLAQIDSLTQIYNRGYFSECARASVNRARVKNVNACLVLLDLDHFKLINDCYGHQTGDWALQKTVSAIQNCLDGRCLIGRMGGEEFGVLMFDASITDGLKLAEDCRNAIESIDTLQSGHKYRLTASFGVSDTAQVGYNLDNLFSASDLALYQSKNSGRNRVYEYHTGLSQPDELQPT